MEADRLQPAPLCVGDWIIDPMSGDMSRGTDTTRLDERSLRLFLFLVEHAGQVLSADEILKQVWQGVIVTPDSIYQAITSLRRHLGDDTKNPAYIATVPRRGYRLIAKVGPVIKPDTFPILPARKPLFKPSPRVLFISALMVVALAVLSIPLMAWRAQASTQEINPRAVAVLPFLDLTDQMSEEPFADGMAEELISQLGKVPGVAVSPPAVLADFKQKRLSNKELAQALRVAFMLEGSVRKSGNTVRVAARLTRASDGFVVWSESYDRSWNDKLMIQEDIAGEVSKALARSIH